MLRISSRQCLDHEYSMYYSLGMPLRRFTPPAPLLPFPLSPSHPFPHPSSSSYPPEPGTHPHPLHQAPSPPAEPWQQAGASLPPQVVPDSPHRVRDPCNPLSLTRCTVPAASPRHSHIPVLRNPPPAHSSTTIAVTSIPSLPLRTRLLRPKTPKPIPALPFLLLPTRHSALTLQQLQLSQPILFPLLINARLHRERPFRLCLFLGFPSFPFLDRAFSFGRYLCLVRLCIGVSCL